MHYHKLPQSYMLFYDDHKTKLLEKPFLYSTTYLAFRKATGLVKASCLCGIISICSTNNQDLGRNVVIKPDLQHFLR